MLRFVILDIVLPLLLLLLVRSVLRSIFGSSNSSVPQNSRQAAPPPVPAGGELKKDPVCGTYVSAAASVTRSVNGQLVHFCSKECRDKFGS